MNQQNNKEKTITMNGINQPTTAEYNLIRSLVYDNFGINLGTRKKALVAARLQKIIKANGFVDFHQYFKSILEDESGAALSTLINRISTNHTYFYREKAHFEFLYSKVFPHLAARPQVNDQQPLHIWSCGCSSGEEAYTLSMLLLDYLAENNSFMTYRILGTDISLDALTKARQGVYNLKNINNLPVRIKHQFMQAVSKDQWTISGKVKSNVFFRRLNLMNTQYPFKNKFQIIFCRNVMIYFDKPTRNNLLDKLSRYLEIGGYLFIGLAERLDHNLPHFRYVEPGIYQRTDVKS